MPPTPAPDSAKHRARVVFLLRALVIGTMVLALSYFAFVLHGGFERVKAMPESTSAH